ncbi:DNA helicase [Mangrovactinospora gilvigrisea]|uniref:DNA 3'-5' helicase n=1 Tax=Mangrovactinospora gilvigrisea TaxID=1428644 RepID=A0A1J7BCU9_9ACTN|nr:UvrD-helicase domain-containing protein [Mangrovactinospora gilvigrisea]OIV36515.1 DNA helicase [Mangrovactinospora gilvigrisea]
MTVHLSLYQKAEQELYKLDQSVKGQFYNFCHNFRENPDHPGLDLKPLKGDGRIFRAKINRSYRALLTRAGVDAKGRERWLVIAVRHRKDVYEQLSVAINRVTGAIEFVDLSVVGESSLRRAGIDLTPAEPEAEDEPEAAPVEAPVAEAPAPPPAPAAPLLAAYHADDLRDLGVADSLIDLALAVTDSAELDALTAGAPLLSRDVLIGLAAGMPLEEVRAEITQPVRAEEAVDPEDFGAALARTPVTTLDEDIQKILEQGDFRAWKAYLHPTQRRLATRHYSGPARVSGGPGTGKTIVALHRVKSLAEQLGEGHDKPILLTTFTKNLTTDLKARLAYLFDDTPELLDRVEITHIDQLAGRVVGENAAAGRTKARIADRMALRELRELLQELDEHRWDPEFLMEEWEQVILGQSIPTRTDYFKARRAGRGRGVTRMERNEIWKILEQFTSRLDKLGVETWGQTAERAARFEIERAMKVQHRREYKEQIGGLDLRHRDDGSGMRYLHHRYRHIVVDEAQDLRPAHWKMLRAMVEPGPDDLFLAGDTYQRIYNNQVSLGALGINIRGRSTRLTLSYRTTKEILSKALTVMAGQDYDDMDDGSETLKGYRSVLHGPVPDLVEYDFWPDELKGLAKTLDAWKRELATDGKGTARDIRGSLAVCVAERDKVNEVMYYLETEAGIRCSELTKDGPRGNGEVHVGTMHRFKGLEYQKLAIVAASEGIIPPTSRIARLEAEDPARYTRELHKSRSLLFVAATRARDALTISWHGHRSRFLSA